MALHETMRITVPVRAMDKPHLITGVRTKRQATPHTMVLLATERMAIASLSLTTIKLSTEKGKTAHLGLKPKVIMLRIDAPTTSRVTNHTITTTVNHKTAKGNHKGVATTPALRKTAKDVPGITATIVRNQIENVPMTMVTIVHNAILSTTKVEDTQASTKGQRTAIKSGESHIHVSRVVRRHFKGGKRVGGHRKLSVMHRTKSNSKAITSNLAMTPLPKRSRLQENLSKAIDMIVMDNTRTDMPLKDHGLYSAGTPSSVPISMKTQKNSSTEFTRPHVSIVRFMRRQHHCLKRQ
jgi:hypothetical protein